MKCLTAIICLTIGVLLGCVGVSWGADFQKGLAAHERGDFNTALREWKPLAEQGDARAQGLLGGMYELGQGVPQDDKAAVKWYRLAAKQRYAYAQYRLGWMYGSGRGVPQDYVYAHMWFNLAAASGNEQAVKTRDYLAKDMTSAQIGKAQSLATECIRKKYKGCESNY